MNLVCEVCVFEDLAFFSKDKWTGFSDIGRNLVNFPFFSDTSKVQGHGNNVGINSVIRNQNYYGQPQYKFLYAIDIEVYEEPVPRTMKIPNCAVKFEAGEEKRIVYENFYWWV